MKKYKLIGLTGTTGAGKSVVSDIFRENGFAVISADSLAREAVKNPLVLQSLRMNFGEDVVCKNELNRKLLAERAFKNLESKKLLDSITHPFISALFADELKRLSSLGEEKILFDASQLFESGLDALCDYVISVIADDAERLSRIRERDDISENQAKARMSVQFSDDYFIKNSDYVIENNSDINSLKQAVNNIISKI